MGAGPVVPQRPVLHVLRRLDVRLEPLGDLPGHQPQRRPRQLDQPRAGRRLAVLRQLQRHRPQPRGGRAGPLVAGLRVLLVGHQDDRARPRHRPARGLLDPLARGARRRPDRGAVRLPPRQLLLPLRVLRLLLPRRRQHLPHHGRPLHLRHRPLHRPQRHGDDRGRRHRNPRGARKYPRTGRRGRLRGHRPRHPRLPLLRRQRRVLPRPQLPHLRHRRLALRVLTHTHERFRTTVAPCSLQPRT
ncbi:Xylose isomerase domain protein TIM barrel [Actinacidiphila bryophytorum]|uniref:Xylose isomerase domain protein TIM barrel n=1 Tax=Actinacidiphila bryophytorum TaxID=1436133 RepID=A0A9W4GYK9_9ACTN|nr:Xylose isomerase domain protein TIM barrel [Actinacidiphila bryophytorum]